MRAIPNKEKNIHMYTAHSTLLLLLRNSLGMVKVAVSRAILLLFIRYNCFPFLSIFFFARVAKINQFNNDIKVRIDNIYPQFDNGE